MAYILKVNGEKQELPDTELKTLQGAVGGYIEIVPCRLPNGELMIANEEGLLRDLPINPYATQLVGVPIVGDVVIAKKGELK